MTINLAGYCGKCWRKQMTAMDIHKDPTREEALIEIQVNSSMTDPRNPENKIRTLVTEKHIQKPARICTGCLSDITDTPTADAIWVGGKKK